MKFTVALKADLEPALATVKGSMGNKEDMESYLLFRIIPTVPAHDGVAEVPAGVEVLTHAGRIFSSSPFKAGVDLTDTKIDKFTIYEPDLKELLSTFDDNATVLFETSADGKKVNVSDQFDPPSPFEVKNPEDFPLWDKLMTDAKVKATISSVRLVSALNQAKVFASTEDGRHPELCVCEVKDGLLSATDGTAAALLSVVGLEDSVLRVHYKDVGGVLSFLASSKDPEETVEVLEYDRGVFFRRKSDQAVFGEGRFLAGLPTLGNPDPEDQCWWDLPVKRLLTCLKAINATADKKNPSITISWSDVAGPICLSKAAKTGDIVKRETPCSATGMQQGVVPFTGEFDVDFNSLKNTLTSAGVPETIRIGVNRRKKGGYLRFSNNPLKTATDPGDTYQIILRWSRSTIA